MTLRQFLAAPARVQEQFERRVFEQIQADLDAERYIAQAADDDPIPPEQPTSKIGRPVRWGPSWQRRAQITTLGERQGVDRYATLADERQRLMAVVPADYIEQLSDAEVPERGHVRCPLPDHDERTGSFVAYGDGGRGWHCFGCGKGGTIYDFAGHLWGLPTRGAGFMQIHERLCEAFGIERADPGLRAA
jgi:hypothetical protein